MRREPFGTFSIVGYDPETGDLGVAVASKFFAVGSVVPWARAGIGAVATQSYANTSFGPRGLRLLADGFTPDETLSQLLESDEGRETRQVAIVDAKGDAVNYTGSECLPWAGGIVGEGYAVQGNILVGEGVVRAMASAYETTEDELAWRLMAALEAGDEAGGDARGKQSAALLVVREKGDVFGYGDRYVDVRSDDDAEPVRELRRLLGIRLNRP